MTDSELTCQERPSSAGSQEINQIRAPSASNKNLNLSSTSDTPAQISDSRLAFEGPPNETNAQTLEQTETNFEETAVGEKQIKSGNAESEATVETAAASPTPLENQTTDGKPPPADCNKVDAHEASPPAPVTHELETPPVADSGLEQGENPQPVSVGMSIDLEAKTTNVESPTPLDDTAKQDEVPTETVPQDVAETAVVTPQPENVAASPQPEVASVTLQPETVGAPVDATDPGETPRFTLLASDTGRAEPGGGHATRGPATQAAGVSRASKLRC